jgi:hypothetical protein
VAEKPPEDETDNEALDTSGETVSEYRSGSVEAELEVARSVAKRMGWTPKEDWKRDPARWVDAPEFLEKTPTELDTLKERLRRTSQAAADAIEEERRRARIEAQNEIRSAAEAQQLEKVSGPPAETVAWIARNEWFNQDPAARAVAAAVTERLHSQGKSNAEQLEAAEAEVKRRFPEYFGQAEVRREPDEVKAPDVRRQAPIAPQVQAGTRGSDGSRQRVRTFADINPSDRALFDKHFRKRFEAQLGSKDAAEAKYAASYWREKE